MSRPVTIHIFLADGTAEGLRIIEKSNWTGQALDFARSDWTGVRSREDFGRPGVYVLKGVSDTGGSHIYVGEADELRSRLNHHFANVDFWTRAIAFVSKDQNLNKAYVRYLEAKLVELGKRSKLAALENVTIPNEPALSERDRAEANAFLDEMLVIYPLLGVNAFEQVKANKAAGSSRLTLKAKGIVAHARDTAEGFVVEAGSMAVVDEVPSIHEYLRALRYQLKAGGVLAPQDGQLVVTQDYLFSSPSTAAGVLLGRSSNGRVEWQDSSGRTLKAIQTAQTA
jgi:hypothetical protein